MVPCHPPSRCTHNWMPCWFEGKTKRTPPTSEQTSASQPLDDGAGAETTAAAHRDQAVAPVDAVELVHRLGHQDGAGSAERVAVGDGPAVGVGLLQVGADLLGPRQHDRGECLVDL